MHKALFHSVLVIAFFFTSSAVASVANLKCIPADIKAQNKTIILPGVSEPRTTKIYFIKNLSQQSLWVDHPVEHKGASAGWSSYLRPGKWSAILLNRKNFILRCAVIQPGKLEYRDCMKAISVCTVPHSSLESKRKGSYWLAEDLAWEDLAKNLEKRGVRFN